MALFMSYQEESGGSYTTISPASFGIRDLQLTFSDSHPSSLRFNLIASQETMPLEYRWFIKLWDSSGTTPDGVTQSSDNPLFEGHIWEIQPAESNLLSYVAYDPTMIAGREIAVMSTAWEISAGAGQAPLPNSEAVPRLIYNNTIENDNDAAFERAKNASVGDIIADVLLDARYPLHWFNAAPSPAGTTPYIGSELTGFSYKPQAKVVSTNESIRQFVDRLTQAHYPEYAFLWTPGTRLWHWYSRLTATAETVTLNEPGFALSSGNTTTVLSMELHRSLEGRYPAVEFRGPETAGPTEIFSTLDGSLTPIGDYTVLENYIDSGGIGTVIAYNAYQIVDEEKRRGAKFLPSLYLIRENDYFQVGTRSPKFECTFDGGNTWQGIESIWFDFGQGSVIIPEGVFIYFWSDQELEAGSNRHFWTPNGYRLIWAPYTEPITVRYPATGFEGTSYTVAGQQSVYYQYDEMLAVGYNRIGLPVTTATRIAQYTLLAQAIHRAKKDIVYTGGMLLEGLIYDFCRLNKSINLAAVDHNGAAVTTGWEAIAAIVTDVEYNFADGTTHVTFSQEALAAWGDSQDLLKERLRIGNVDVIRVMNAYNTYRPGESTYANKPTHYQEVSGVVFSDYDLYYDRNLGTVDNALGGPQYDTSNLSSNIQTDVGVVTPEGFDPWNPGAYNPDQSQQAGE